MGAFRNSLKWIAGRIPYTTTRQKRLFHRGLAGMASKGDAVCELEWPDHTMSYHSAVWVNEINGWLLDNGKTIFPRGRGGSPKHAGGVPIIQAHAEDAGVVSTTAALLAYCEEYGHFVRVDERNKILEASNLRNVPAEEMPPESLAEYTDAEGIVDVDQLQQLVEKSGTPAHRIDGAGNASANGEVAADGGVARAADHIPNLPVTGLTYDAVEYSLADAVLYDPNPVTEQDARLAAKYFEQAAQDPSDLIRYILIGGGIVFATIALFIIINWLLSQIGGGGGGGGTQVFGLASAVIGAVARPVLEDGDEGGGSVDEVDG